MALLHELALENAVVAALASGMNAELIASCVAYGVEPIEFDFSEYSRSFVRQYVDPNDIEICEVLEFPAGCIYIGESGDTGQPRGIRFNGAAMVHLDFYIRNRDGINGSKASRLLKQINDAVLSTFAAYSWPIANGITISYTRRTSSKPEHLIPLGDGEGQKLSIEAQFGIQVT